MKKYFGPSTLVAAAFIGPGTLTTCTLAGVNSGYTLLWALLFSIFATIVLQEMAARLGFITQQGLGEAITKKITKPFARYLAFFLVISAILVGNTAYEAGNITGAVLGLNLIIGVSAVWPVAIGLISIALLLFGGYKAIEKILIGLVLLMSLCFIITVIMVQPDLSEIAKGLFPTKASATDHYLLVMGLIGTTVVPYNLFLHASTISLKYNSESQLKEVRIENIFAIALGGLISIFIVITAAASATKLTEVSSASDLATQLEPLFGTSAKYVMGIGLVAAGLSSTLTAPLAAAYAAKGLFGWSNGEKNVKFISVWLLIIVIGVIVSLGNFKPILVIKFAQITNALLLPFISIYLLYISNSKELMGYNSNSGFINALAMTVIGITILLSLKTLSSIFGLI